ncbi:YegP family protein [Flavobacterium sp.]
MGNSEMYESAAARDNGIESVFKNAPEAEVKEEL